MYALNPGFEGEQVIGNRPFSEAQEVSNYNG